MGSDRPDGWPLSMSDLLTRDEFRNGVFKRDGHQCVLCGEAGAGDPDHREYSLDAHHIVERRLWLDGGYYLDNGATLCHQHHVAAEQTTLTCDAIRQAAGITRIVLPEHLYDDLEYDKWGNILLANGSRLRGELFYDASVQKILSQGGVLGEFSAYVKYPRTYHLPWSNPSRDDRGLRSLDIFEGQEVVVTEKLDGENTTMYRDHIHARSLEFATGPDRGMVKAVHAQVAYEIPEGWRLCGENLYARHSIHYKGLASYFYLFSIWNERNDCLSWDETEDWAALLGLKIAPVLYRGIWDEGVIRSLHQPVRGENESEGYVVRLARGFPYGDFRRSLAKFVRKGHVTTEQHWRHKPMVPNEAG